MVTAETAPLVKYLKADLQRIVNSANEELKNIRCAGLIDSTRQAEEARGINDARAFAGRRVESTVRHLHKMKSKLPPEHRPVNGVVDTEKTARFKLAPPRPEPTPEIPAPPAPQQEDFEPAPAVQADNWEPEPLEDWASLPTEAPTAEPALAEAPEPVQFESAESTRSEPVEPAWFEPAEPEKAEPDTFEPETFKMEA